MRVHRFAKLVTATIKLKEARKVIRKWYVYCNFKRHLLVLHNLSCSAIRGGVPVPARWEGSQSQLGGSQSQPGGSQFWGGPSGGGPSPSQGGSQFQGGPSPSPSQGGPSPSWGVPVPAGGGSQPCDLSQHAILILPLWCPSCK